MPAEARRLQIIEMLGKTGTGVVSVNQLAKHFRVSEMTVRRDLDWLEQRSILTRVHGGAMVYQKDEEKPFDDRLTQSNPQKAAIGWAAAQLVKPGERVILDAGTTTQQVARNLVSLGTLTIITNNVHIAAELSHYPQIETILLGGLLKHQEMCTVGSMVTQALAVLAVDKVFLSAAGFDVRQGISDLDMREVEVKQAMMHSAREVILVCDSSKWGAVKLVRTAVWSQIQRIVTDDLILPEAVEALQAAGVEVITPERIAASMVRSGAKGQAGMRVFLGVDAGTTSMKAAIFDLDGRQLGIATSEYPLDTPGPGRVELDAEIYWQTCCQVVRRAMDRSGLGPEEVAGLAISSQGETFVAVDRAGTPLCPAIVWLDNRAVQEADQIRAAFDPLEFFHATGQPESVPAWPACKILWLRNHAPEVFTRASRFLLVEDYLIFRMTGEYATNTALQTSSLFLDIRSRDWWQPMLDAVGVTKKHFGSLVGPGTQIGKLTSTAAETMGLTTNCFVATGGMDQVVSAVGAGNLSSGVVTETTGTALVALVSFDRPAYDAGGRLPCHVHAAPGAYAVMPWCQTAGMALRWFRDQFFGIEADLARQSGLDPYLEMTNLAGQVPPGSDGLVVLPHLEGTASPEYNPHARAVFYGATLRHTRGHFVRGILESVAFMLRKNLALIQGMGVPVAEVRSLGGAARSPLWLQIKADVLQKPIITLENEETSCLGAALIDAATAGEFSSLSEGVARMVRTQKRFLPNPDNAGVYDRSYTSYLELYDRLEPMFRSVEEAHP